MAAAKLLLLPIVLAQALRLTQRPTTRRRTSRTVVAMRDSSSVTWLKNNDRVKVIESVMSRGEDLKGRTGTVTMAWEKCEVDPHCCCAELAEEDVAVHVDLDPPDARPYYFAEHELAKVAAAATAAVAGAAQAATELEPLLATGPRRDVALALVFPLVAYKAAAVANGNELMLPLDVAIALAMTATIYYCI